MSQRTSSRSSQIAASPQQPSLSAAIEAVERSASIAQQLAESMRRTASLYRALERARADTVSLDENGVWVADYVDAIGTRHRA